MKLQKGERQQEELDRQAADEAADEFMQEFESLKNDRDGLKAALSKKIQSNKKLVSHTSKTGVRKNTSKAEEKEKKLRKAEEDNKDSKDNKDDQPEG